MLSGVFRPCYRTTWLGLELGLGLSLALGGIIFVGQHECGMRLREGKAHVWLACMM